MFKCTGNCSECGRCRNIHQDKCNLKRAPSEVVVRVLRIGKIIETAFYSIAVFLCIALDAVLQKYYLVHETESLEGGIVILDNADTFTDTLQSILAAGNNLVANILFKARISHLGISEKRRVNPFFI